MPVPKLGNNETTRARGRPGSKLWPSKARGFSPSPICTIMLWPSTGEELRPVPHLYDNATAIDGSSHFVPVPKLGNNETTRARVRPGSRLWPSTGEGLCPVPHLYDNAMAVDGGGASPRPPLG